MGIILKDEKTNEILFYMKGADVVMASIVQFNDWLEEEVDNMAREGKYFFIIKNLMQHGEMVFCYQNCSDLL